MCVDLLSTTDPSHPQRWEEEHNLALKRILAQRIFTPGQMGASSKLMQNRRKRSLPIFEPLQPDKTGLMECDGGPVEVEEYKYIQIV